MSTASNRHPIDLREAEARVRAAEAARRERLRARAVDTRKPLAAPTLATAHAPRPHWRWPRFIARRAPLWLVADIATVVAVATLIPWPTARIVSPHLPTPTDLAATTSPAVTSHNQVDRLVITALGIDAPVTAVGLSNGLLIVPGASGQIGRYKRSALPGSVGTAVLAGRAGTPDKPGVLKDLNHLGIGDSISYIYADGRSFTYRVASSSAYPLSSSTGNMFFTSTANPTLNVLTAYGVWNAASRHYDQCWIVTSQLVGI